MRTLYIHTIISMILCLFCCVSCNSEIPEEYFDQSTQNALSNLNQIIYSTTASTNSLKAGKATERFKIVHISDIHLPRTSVQEDNVCLKNLKEAISFSNLNDSKINAIVATGDYVSNNEKDTNIENYAIEELNEKYFKIKDCLSRCGNVVTSYNNTKSILEILFSFFKTRINLNLM